MHDFNNSKLYLSHLCDSIVILSFLIFVQELWLTSSGLCKLNDVHADFNFYGCSAMDNACSRGIIHGRPFGGVGVLYRRKLSLSIRTVGCHASSRCVAISLDVGSVQLLCFGVYLPCDDSSSTVLDVFGYIESVAELYNEYKCLIIGDFNFKCDATQYGYNEFMSINNDLSLVLCDSMDSNNVG